MEEKKRCWICLAEDDEEENNTSNTANYTQKTWISPCRCKNSLKFVHEECLLRWISQKEITSAEVCCPACGYRYEIVESIDYVRKIAKTARTVSVIYVSSAAYGVYAIIAVCGDEFLDSLLDIGGTKLWVGLPLIPVSLILSRLQLGDILLPLISISLFGLEPIEITFPPSPLLVFSVYPWARIAYNSLYEFAETALLGPTSEDDSSVQEYTSGQGFVMGALMWPSILQLGGKVLGSITQARRILPDLFDRNIAAGCAIILIKDIISLSFNFYKKRVKVKRQIKNLCE